MFSISSYVDAHRNECYDRLNAIMTQGDWTGWIVFFLTAVGVQAAENTQRVRKIASSTRR